MRMTVHPAANAGPIFHALIVDEMMSAIKFEPASKGT